MAKKAWTEPKPLCEKLQYLIGVPAQYLDNFETMNKGIVVEVRRLCNLRSIIIANFTDINNQFREGVSLGDIKDTSRLVADCAKCGIIIENKSSLSRNIIELNEIINEKIKPISLGFRPLPNEWVQELFAMPNGDTVDGVRAAVRRYRQYKNFYPYQKYINWNFAETSEEKRSKNIFGNDRELQEILAEAHTNKSSQLFDFIGTSQNVVVVVDCENSDAQRLYDSILPMQAFVSKVILIDDEHTNAMWEELAIDFRANGVTVEHDELARLKEQKSLVDLRMVAKTCEEFYKNNVQDFILASSDSDIWALITSLPNANILVLAEKCKCGDVLIEALTQSNIKRVFMEDIVEDSTKLMDRIMHKKIDDIIDKQCIDVRRFVISAAQKLNLYLDKDTVDRYTSETLAEICMSKDEEGGRITLSIE